MSITPTEYPVAPRRLPGQLLPCLVVNEKRVLVHPTLNEMTSFVVNPKATEDPKRVAEDYHVREAWEIRKKVQRMLGSNKAKRDNVPAYSRYLINGMIKGDPYITPPMSLIFTTQLDIYRASEDAESATLLHIPPGLKGVHDDGETQYLARLEVMNQHPETASEPIAVVIDHGRDVEWGGQAFHDLNLLAVPMSAAQAIAVDSRDPATALAKKLVDVLPQLHGRVSFEARQISAKSNDVMTITTVRRAVVASLVGRRVFAMANKPYVDDIPADKEHEVIETWRQVFTALATSVSQETVLGLPAVLTAIGIAVNEAAEPDGAGLPALIRSLETVEWEKNTDAGARRWAGVAGKLTDTNRFSAVGGVKDLGYRVLEALTDPNSANYRRVRGIESGGAADLEI